MTSVQEERPVHQPTQEAQTTAPQPLAATTSSVRELAGWERGVAEHHAEEVPKCPVLHPEHSFRKRWDLVQVFALLYVAFLVPCTSPAASRVWFCAVSSARPPGMSVSCSCLTYGVVAQSELVSRLICNHFRPNGRWSS